MSAEKKKSQSEGSNESDPERSSSRIKEKKAPRMEREYCVVEGTDVSGVSSIFVIGSDWLNSDSKSCIYPSKKTVAKTVINKWDRKKLIESGQTMSLPITILESGIFGKCYKI